MPFNLLLLPLLGGFIFVRYWNRTRYHTIRADKERLLILASIAGLSALLLAFALKLTYSRLFPCQPAHFCLSDWWKQNIPVEYAGVSLIAFFIGASLWYPLNYFWKRENEIGRVIQENADSFELMLKRAQDTGLKILVTMNSGKVYIGWVSQTIDPATPLRSIELTPVASGYRDETKQFVMTTSYSGAYEGIIKEIDDCVSKIKELEDQRASEIADLEGDERRLPLDDEIELLYEGLGRLDLISDSFRVVLPLTGIVSASFYDDEVSRKYFQFVSVEEDVSDLNGQ